MEYISFVNGIIVTGGELLKRKALVVNGSNIVDVIDESVLPAEIKRIDLQGNYVSPGFIDMQLNGAGGALFGCNPTRDGLAIMERTMMKEGVTGFLATATTNDLTELRTMIQYAVDYRSLALGNYIGLHLEGPYINPLSKGAHPTKYIRQATVNEVSDLLQRAKGEIKMMTMAPELQPDGVIRFLDEQGVIISIGHSAATYDEAMAFFTGRKRLATHLYNGMQPMHHRKPGLIPAIFRAKPFTGIVADGIHVSFPMVRLAKQVLGESLILVTDAATPCNEGVYRHIFKGDRYVTISSDGKETLSGSALSMLKAVQNCVNYVDIPLAEAINMATLYPAQALRINNRLGQIRSGFEANLVVFDRDFKLQQVYFRGKKQF